MHIGLDRVDGLFDDELHADRRRQMDHDVTPVDELGEQRLVLNGIHRVMEFRTVLEVQDVVDGSRRQVVEHEHLVAPL